MHVVMGEKDIFYIRTVPPRDDWNPNPQIFVGAL